MAIQKIKLGARPTSFKRVVTFPMLDGTTGAIEVDYKYRTRSEFGRFVDEQWEAANSATQAAQLEPKSRGKRGAKRDAESVQPTGADEKFTMLAQMQRTSRANAEYILQIAVGWNLDEPFGLGSLEQLSDELPAAAVAIMESYRVAVTEGRAGN